MECLMDIWQDLVDKIESDWANAHVETWNSFHIIRLDMLMEREMASFFEWQQQAPSMYFFDPLTRTEHAGFGDALLEMEQGSDAFGQTGHRIQQTRLPDGLRWFGGIAFDPTVEPAGIWREWPHALWFVPNLSLTRPANSNKVEVIFIAPMHYKVPDVLELLQRLSGCARTSRSQDMSEPSYGRVHSPRQWADVIEKALNHIKAGQLHKVVLARQAHAKVRRPLSEALQKLLEQYPQSQIFALQWAGVWLLGASPERLARSRGGLLEVDCLAGTTGRGGDESEDDRLATALMSSRKNRQEHAAVVRYVADRINLVADDITYADKPEMKRLANVQHLYTPVQGRLKPGMTLFDAVQLLHPTPAVGGVPRSEALSFIRREEEWPRGFYAGAIGFVDGAGDGLLCVALRTAAVRYPDGLLFAGCGIVDGSDPSGEWQETEMKLKPMRMALE